MSVNEGEELNLKCNYKEGNLPATYVDYKFDETVVKRLKPVSCYTPNYKRSIFEQYYCNGFIFSVMYTTYIHFKIIKCIHRLKPAHVFKSLKLSKNCLNN